MSNFQNIQVALGNISEFYGCEVGVRKAHVIIIYYISFHYIKKETEETFGIEAEILFHKPPYEY